MDTNELITALARDTRPVRSDEALRRMLLALAGGAAAAMVLVSIFLGNPFYGTEQLGVMTIGVKMGFTSSLLLLAAFLLYRAGRPGDDARSGSSWLAAPFVIVALLAALALFRVEEGARHALVFGSSWQTCLVSVSLLSIPVYALLVRAFRSLAPTDLKLAGMLAGFASGATAALVYSLHCPETSPAFLLIWYGLGILIAGLAGRAAGPLLLRW